MKLDYEVPVRTVNWKRRYFKFVPIFAAIHYGAFLVMIGIAIRGGYTPIEFMKIPVIGFISLLLIYPAFNFVSHFHLHLNIVESNLVAIANAAIWSLIVVALWHVVWKITRLFRARK